MHIALNRFGEVVVEGEGTFRVPMGVDETDNSLSNPVTTAEALREHERQTYAHMAAIETSTAQRRRLRLAQEDRMNEAAEDQAAFQREAEADYTGGQHPLTYLAALQTMAGNSMEQISPISGYTLSQDGVPAFDKTMNGYSVMRGMGDWLSDIQSGVEQVQNTVSDVQDYTTQAQDIYATAQGIISPQAPPPPPPPVIAPVVPPAITKALSTTVTVAGKKIPVAAIAAAMIGGLVIWYGMKK